MLLLLAAALPGLFWEGAPDTAPVLREAGIRQVLVPAARLEAWKGVPEVSVKAGDPQGAVKLLPPTVNYRMDQASASRAPWLDSNGWQFLRQPRGRFYYDVTGKAAALAAAEAFCYGADAMIRTDAEGLKPLGQMLDFLRGADDNPMPALADIGLIDNGSKEAGEVINLMVRYNLLFRIVAAPDKSFKLTVRLGSKEYPLEDAKDPSVVARQIRADLTDDKRSVRIYGSTVVVARLTGQGGRARLQLINYAGASRNVDGIRVRVAGRYPKHTFASAGAPGAQLMDYTVDANATEFTLPQLKTYAVIDLSR
jgi:hypothetical protein